MYTKFCDQPVIQVGSLNNLIVRSLSANFFREKLFTFFKKQKNWVFDIFYLLKKYYLYVMIGYDLWKFEGKIFFLFSLQYPCSWFLYCLKLRERCKYSDNINSKTGETEVFLITARQTFFLHIIFFRCKKLFIIKIVVSPLASRVK